MAGNEQRNSPRQERDASKSNGSAAKAVRAAVREFRDLTGLEPDAVTGVRGIDDGWSVLVDVVELERIPSSTSVMATYRVDVDPRGELRSYERLRRYNRGAADPT